MTYTYIPTLLYYRDGIPQAKFNMMCHLGKMFPEGISRLHHTNMDNAHKNSRFSEVPLK